MTSCSFIYLEEVDIKQVDTAQPVLHVPAIQEGDQHESVVDEEVVIKQVNTAQPAQQVIAMQQEDQHEGVMVW